MPRGAEQRSGRRLVSAARDIFSSRRKRQEQPESEKIVRKYGSHVPERRPGFEPIHAPRREDVYQWAQLYGEAAYHLRKSVPEVTLEQDNAIAIQRGMDRKTYELTQSILRQTGQIELIASIEESVDRRIEEERKIHPD